MSMNTATTPINSTVESWLAKYQPTNTDASGPATAPANESAQDALLRATALVASLTITRTEAFAKELARVIRAVNSLGPDGAPALRHLVADTRLPGWARLRVALELSDAALVTELARHTGALITAGAIRPGGNPPGSHLLPLPRRVQLTAAGMLTRELFTPAELAEGMKSLASKRWTERPDLARNLARSLSFDAMPFAAAYDAIKSLNLGARTQEFHQAALKRLAESTRCFTDVTSLDAAEVEAFAATFGEEPVRSLATTAPESLIMKLLTSTRRRHRLLGLALVDSGSGSSYTALDEVLAGVEEAGEALLSRRWSGVAAMRAVRRRVEVLGGLDEVCVRLLAKNRQVIWTAAHAETVTKLAAFLRTQAWVLAYLSVGHLAQAHGYGMSHGFPPPPVRDLLVRARWLDPSAEDEELLAWLPSLDLDALDKARAQLAGEFIDPDHRTVPSGLVRGDCSVLLGDIAFHCSYGHRRGETRFGTRQDRDEHWGAWLRALRADVVPELLAAVSRTRARSMDCVGIPPVLAEFLEEAFAAAETVVAKRALAAELSDGVSVRLNATMPSTMTLVDYARSLSNVSARLPIAS